MRSLFPLLHKRLVREYERITLTRSSGHVRCRFEDDLLKNSSVPIETLVKVGESIGRSVMPTAGYSAASVLRGGDVTQNEASSATGTGAAAGAWDVWGTVVLKCNVL